MNKLYIPGGPEFPIGPWIPIYSNEMKEKLIGNLRNLNALREIQNIQNEVMCLSSLPFSPWRPFSPVFPAVFLKKIVIEKSNIQVWIMLILTDWSFGARFTYWADWSWSTLKASKWNRLRIIWNLWKTITTDSIFGNFSLIFFSYC